MESIPRPSRRTRLKRTAVAICIAVNFAVLAAQACGLLRPSHYAIISPVAGILAGLYYLQRTRGRS